MIGIPESGMSPSAKVHNCDMLGVADWILSSSLFCEEDVSKSDVLDALMENNIYKSQDFCQEFILSVWTMLDSFFDDIKTPALRIDSKAVRFLADWKSDKALAYCLTASLRPNYESWSTKHCGDYIQQGAILEELTQIALSRYHPNARFKTTGWSGLNTNQQFSALIAQICADTNFTEQNLDLWDNGTAKDMGLDVYGFFPAFGRLPSSPFLMFQCASGSNWKKKRHTPDLGLWQHVIDIHAKPVRGMSIPFLVEEKEFKKSLVLIGGPLIDRKSLLSAISGDLNIPAGLQSTIESWVEPRVTNLEKL
jgi:hypothetical protein